MTILFPNAPALRIRSRWSDVVAARAAFAFITRRQRTIRAPYLPPHVSTQRIARAPPRMRSGPWMPAATISFAMGGTDADRPGLPRSHRPDRLRRGSAAGAAAADAGAGRVPRALGRGRPPPRPARRGRPRHPCRRDHGHRARRLLRRQGFVLADA